MNGPRGEWKQTSCVSINNHLCTEPLKILPLLSGESTDDSPRRTAVSTFPEFPLTALLSQETIPRDGFREVRHRRDARHRSSRSRWRGKTAAWIGIVIEGRQTGAEQPVARFPSGPCFELPFPSSLPSLFQVYALPTVLV